MNRKLEIKDFVFVGLQFILFVAYIFDFEFLAFTIPKILKIIFLIFTIIGVGIILLSIAQLNTNLSPFPTPKSGSRLIINGLYKLVRHPIYSGILLCLFSYGIYAMSSFKILITLILLGLFYFKSIYEERLLTEVFPDYESYCKITGRFLPKMKLR